MLFRSVRFKMKWLGLDNEVYVDDGTPVTPPTIATRMDSPFNRKLFKLPRYLETVPCRVPAL